MNKNSSRHEVIYYSALGVMKYCTDLHTVLSFSPQNVRRFYLSVSVGRRAKILNHHLPSVHEKLHTTDTHTHKNKTLTRWKFPPRKGPPPTRSSHGLVRNARTFIFGLKAKGSKIRSSTILSMFNYKLVRRVRSG